MKKNIKLTVAIPTYNRLDSLLCRINELLVQLDANDRIVISDNNTLNFPNCDFFKAIDERILIYGNKSNLGANANILKCFELVETGWMWLLSDDDIVMYNAIELIKSTIEKYDSDFINFTTELIKTEREDIFCRGVDDYLENIHDNFSNQLLISNNVYNIDSMVKYLKFAYMGCYFNAPHIAAMYVALENNASILLSSSEIVKWNKPDIKTMWQYSSLFNVLLLPDVFSKSIVRKKTLQMIMKSLPSIDRFIAQLCYHKLYNNEDNDNIDSYAIRILSLYKLYGSAFVSFKINILLMLLKYPKFLFGAYELIYKLSTKKKLRDTLQNRGFQFYL